MQQPFAVIRRRRGDQSAGVVRPRSLQGAQQFIVTRKRAAPLLGKRGGRFGFAGKKVLEETRRTAHGLAGVVENVVEPRQPLEQKSREDFDARSMPQVEAVDLQTRAEGRKIRFPRIAVGGIHRKAGGDDDMRAGSQEFQGGLKTDLHPGAGDQRVVTVEIRRLLALGIIEVAARIA